MSVRADAYRKRAHEVRQNLSAGDKRLEELALNIARAFDSLAAHTDWLETEFSLAPDIASADTPETHPRNPHCVAPRPYCGSEEAQVDAWASSAFLVDEYP